MSQKRWMTLGVILLGLSVCGCPELTQLLGASNTTIQLVNNGSFPVTVELYYHDDQLALESSVKTFGEKVEITVAAGDTYSLPVDCTRLQSIYIDKAELNLLGTIGPESDTGVYRDGSDFNCGNTLTFTFSHPALPIELNIAFSAS